jgi:D-alanine-D-alanine ligase
LVLTADHRLPDASKPGGRFGELDRRYRQSMQEALRTLTGYEFCFLDNHEELLARLQTCRPEFVLNLCDTGFRNVAEHELQIPAVLELLDIPYSGATAACIALCYDKALVRLIADSLGVATPREVLILGEHHLELLDTFQYPALIKPNRADGSLGITRDSVAANAAQARKRVQQLRHELPANEILVQEFLPGPEYSLALIGNPGRAFQTLPALAVDYSQLTTDLPPILTYESKTDPSSPYWRAIKLIPASLPRDVLREIREAAERLFERLQCRDYARFDLRTASDGSIRLMEVNPNPAWDPEAKLARMAELGGISYAQMFEAILETAQMRLQV